jgi:hypothetical protein
MAHIKMDSRLQEILKEFELFSVKSRKRQKKLQSELEEIANSERDEFEKIVRKIVPSNESILFEIYESLAINPNRWIDFIISEFHRIKDIAEKAEPKDQDAIVEPLLALSFFARKEFKGLEKLIYEFSQALKSSSNPVVKMSMDLLMDSYFIDFKRYANCKILVEEQAKSTDTNIKEFAKKLLKDKPINPVWSKLKNLLLENSWILWLVILLLLIGFESGFKTGFIFIGLFGAGSLLGYLVTMIINVMLRRARLISILKELALFIAILIVLYYSVDNKRIMALIIPLGLPILIGGLLTLRR